MRHLRKGGTSKLLTDSLDQAANDYQEEKELEEKEELIDKLIAIVDDGLREGNWDWNFVVADLLGDYKDRSVQEIIEQKSLEI